MVSTLEAPLLICWGDFLRGFPFHVLSAVCSKGVVAPSLPPTAPCVLVRVKVPVKERVWEGVVVAVGVGVPLGPSAPLPARPSRKGPGGENPGSKQPTPTGGRRRDGSKDMHILLGERSLQVGRMCGG